jgi:hypothetical protein
MLWVRPLDSLASQPLRGTEEARSPFWSPDSRFLAFFAQGKLKKVDVSGGPAQSLCDVEGLGSRGGTWSRDGIILFAAGQRSALSRVSASGGVPAPVTTLDTAEQSIAFRNSCPTAATSSIGVTEQSATKGTS